MDNLILVKPTIDLKEQALDYRQILRREKKSLMEVHF